jgi:hypothetical protein
MRFFFRYTTNYRLSTKQLVAIDFRKSFMKKLPQWLQLNISSLPSTPLTKLELWQRLMHAGALPLTPFFWLLPATPQNLDVFHEIATTILQKSGAVITKKSPLIPGYTATTLIATFNTRSNHQYQNFIKHCQKFLRSLTPAAALPRRPRSSLLSFIQLEQATQDCNQLESQYEAIVNCDFFNSSLQAQALATLNRCQTSFEDYKIKIYNQGNFLSP